MLVVAQTVIVTVHGYLQRHADVFALAGCMGFGQGVGRIAEMFGDNCLNRFLLRTDYLVLPDTGIVYFWFLLATGFRLLLGYFFHDRVIPQEWEADNWKKVCKQSQAPHLFTVSSARIALAITIRRACKNLRHL